MVTPQENLETWVVVLTSWVVKPSAYVEELLLVLPYVSMEHPKLVCSIDLPITVCTCHLGLSRASRTNIGTINGTCHFDGSLTTLGLLNVREWYSGDFDPLDGLPSSNTYHLVKLETILEYKEVC